MPAVLGRLTCVPARERPDLLAPPVARAVGSWQGRIPLVDPAVAAVGQVVVGSGLRRSRLVLPGVALADLPGAQVVPGHGVPVPR